MFESMASQKQTKLKLLVQLVEMFFFFLIIIIYLFFMVTNCSLEVSFIFVNFFVTHQKKKIIRYHSKAHGFDPLELLTFSGESWNYKLFPHLITLHQANSSWLNQQKPCLQCQCKICTLLVFVALSKLTEIHLSCYVL